MKIYMDNASTTKLDIEVINIMKSAIENIYGNPSSLHIFGRKAKTEIEKVRKKIAYILNTKPDRIIFTSGGTESNNWIINKSIENLRIKHIITSKIEHSAVLKPLEYFEKKGEIEISYVNLNSLGHIDLQNLEYLLKKTKAKTMVSLMHANNEIGNITDIDIIHSAVLLAMEQRYSILIQHKQWVFINLILVILILISASVQLINFMDLRESDLFI